MIPDRQVADSVYQEREKKVSILEQTGLTEEELLERQQALFAQARERAAGAAAAAGVVEDDVGGEVLGRGVRARGGVVRVLGGVLGVTTLLLGVGNGRRGVRPSPSALTSALAGAGLSEHVPERVVRRIPRYL